MPRVSGHFAQIPQFRDRIRHRADDGDRIVWHLDALSLTTASGTLRAVEKLFRGSKCRFGRVETAGVLTTHDYLSIGRPIPPKCALPPLPEYKKRHSMPIGAAPAPFRWTYADVKRRIVTKRITGTANLEPLEPLVGSYHANLVRQA
jgi:hypothetical protein